MRFLALCVFLPALAAAQECRRVTNDEGQLALKYLRASRTFLKKCATCAEATPESSRELALRIVKEDGRVPFRSHQLFLRGKALLLNEVFVSVGDGSHRRLSSLLSCPSYADPKDLLTPFGDGGQLDERLKPPSSSGCGGPLLERRFEGGRFALPARFALTRYRPHADGASAEWKSPNGETVAIECDVQGTAANPNPQCPRGSVDCVAHSLVKKDGGRWEVTLTGFATCPEDAKAIRDTL